VTSISKAIRLLCHFHHVVTHILSLHRRPTSRRPPDTSQQPFHQAISNARNLLSRLLDTILQAKLQSSQGRHIRWGIFTPLMQAQYYLSIAVYALFPKDAAMRKFSLIFSILTNTERHVDPFDIPHPSRTQLIYWFYALGSKMDYVGETIQWEKRMKTDIRLIRSYSNTRPYHKTQTPHLKLFRLGNATGYTRMISIPIIIMGPVDKNNTVDENNAARTNRYRMERLVMEWIRPIMNMKTHAYMEASKKLHNHVPLSRFRPVFTHALCGSDTVRPCSTTCRNLSNTPRRLFNLTYWQAWNQDGLQTIRHSLPAILDDAQPNQPLLICKHGMRQGLTDWDYLTRFYGTSRIHETNGSNPPFVAPNQPYLLLRSHLAKRHLTRPNTTFVIIPSDAGVILETSPDLHVELLALHPHRWAKRIKQATPFQAMRLWSQAQSIPNHRTKLYTCRVLTHHFRRRHPKIINSKSYNFIAHCSAGISRQILRMIPKKIFQIFIVDKSIRRSLISICKVTYKRPPTIKSILVNATAHIAQFNFRDNPTAPPCTCIRWLPQTLCQRDHIAMRMADFPGLLGRIGRTNAAWNPEPSQQSSMRSLLTQTISFISNIYNMLHIHTTLSKPHSQVERKRQDQDEHSRSQDNFTA